MFSTEEIIKDKIFLNGLSEVCRVQLLEHPTKRIIAKAERYRRIKRALITSKSLLKYWIRKERGDFWQNGWLAIALEYSHKSTNEKMDINCLISYYDKWIESGLHVGRLCNIMNAYSLIYVYEKIGDIKYKNALDALNKFLIDFPKDKYQCLPYKGSSYKGPSDFNIYVDSLGMICPFLCRYGKLVNDQECINLAITQLKNYIENGFDNKKMLPYHAYNAETKCKLGIVGWGRGTGWFLLGIVDSLSYIDPIATDYNYLCKCYKEVIDAAVTYQRDSGYFPWQLEAAEGPIDTSATSMIAYAICRGIKTGILGGEYQKYVDNAVYALYLSTKNGHVQDCSADCRGLGMYPQKYGSYTWAQAPTTALVSMLSAD